MSKRKWRVTKGSSSGVVAADDYAGARKRAAEIGFTDPDDVVLILDNYERAITGINVRARDKLIAAMRGRTQA